MATAFIWHVVKNAFLLSLSLVFLPLNTALITTISILSTLHFWPAAKPKDEKATGDARKTILVTGMSMAKGLAIARLFHRRGHRVIGADAHPLAPGRVSSAVDKFYVLPTPDPHSDGSDLDEEDDDPYIIRLLEIAKKEQIDLWISVSDVHNAIRDALAAELMETHLSAKAIQLHPHDVRSLHEKDAFIEHTRSLGLPVPESEVVSSRAAVIDFLNKRGGLRLHPDKHSPTGHSTQYLLKPIHVDDITRNDAVLLPAATEQETLRRLDSISAFKTPSTLVTNSSKSFAAAAATVYPERPSLLLQEFIRGKEYCTHALVVKGKVRAFTACPSAGVLMHYEAMPEDATLTGAMLAFTRIMAGKGGEGWTGHVSFDFMVKAPTDASSSPPASPTTSSSSSNASSSSPEKEKGRQKSAEEDVRIYPIECNPRVHTATVLFNNTPQLVDEYLSILDDTPSPSSDAPLFPIATKKYYWIGQDLVENVVYPAYLHVTSRGKDVTRQQLAASIRDFAMHVRGWKDGTFEAWDPWPWWWLYHVYWPARFAGFLLRNSRWSSMNVSTGKAFEGR